MNPTWLATLERRATELDLYVDDREIYGADWPLVLIRRIDNAVWCRRVCAELEAA